VNLVALPTNITTKRLVICKAYPVLWHSVKTSSKSMRNATLYFLKVEKLTKKCGSEFGDLLWCHLTPHRKTATRVHNYNPRMHNSPKYVLENLLPVWLLVHTNLFIPCRFWTTYTNFDTCCQRYIAMCGNNFYIGAHLHSRP